MKVLVLRKCDRNNQSNEGKFTYPEKGYVEALDWDGKPECGGGLHGLLWGHGTFDISSYGDRWLVIEVEDTDLIEFDGKCKFKCGTVLLNTDSQLEAVTLLKSHPNYPQDNVLNYDITDKQFAVSGYMSTQNARNKSTQTAGNHSTQTAGDWSVQTAGYRSVQTAGSGSIQTAGNWSNQTVGDRSVQTAGANSVQIGHWYDDNGYHVAVRKVTERTANKPYLFRKGKWTPVKEARNGKVTTR